MTICHLLPLHAPFEGTYTKHMTDEREREAPGLIFSLFL